jgi:hypothetical protein
MGHRQGRLARRHWLKKTDAAVELVHKSVEYLGKAKDAGEASGECGERREKIVVRDERPKNGVSPTPDTTFRGTGLFGQGSHYQNNAGTETKDIYYSPEPVKPKK